jgi:hypothetical protein
VASVTSRALSRHGEPAQERHDSARAVDDQVGAVAQRIGALRAVREDRDGRRTVHSDVLDGVERRAVAEVVTDEEHTGRIALDDQLVQRAALVGPGGSQLEHQPAGHQLEIGLDGQLVDGRAYRRERGERVGRLARVHGDGVALVLEPHARRAQRDEAGEQVARLGDPRVGRRLDQPPRGAVPPLEAVVPADHQPVEPVGRAEPAQREHLGHRPAGHDRHGADVGGEPPDGVDRPGRGRRVLGATDDRSERPVVVERHQGATRSGDQRGDGSVDRCCTHALRHRRSVVPVSGSVW